MAELEMAKAELLERLNNIKDIDAEDELAYEKTYMAFRNLRWIPLFSNLIPKGNFIYRTRTHTNQDRYTNKKDISNPPNKFITKFARLNRPFQSIFYGSEYVWSKNFVFTSFWIK